MRGGRRTVSTGLGGGRERSIVTVKGEEENMSMVQWEEGEGRL